MKKTPLFLFYIMFLTLPLIAQINETGLREDAPFKKDVDSVLSLMTLEEKIGQLAQLSGNGEVTGPVTLNNEYQDAIRKGQVGSMLNINSASYTRKIQKIAVEETRLGIPLIFGYDVIHGYKTIFPVPLGESASWDLEAIEKSARIAAVEASAAGQHWTFAPMVDIARDARWGRIMEGAGEDPFLGSAVAKARVKGFQGDDLSKENTLLACAKHFVAYGAARAGRDYNTVDMSKRMLYEVYLPPFKAAVEADVATFMTSFNELNGVPVTGSKKHVKGILRDDWNYDGLIVSDWASVMEQVIHGAAKDLKEAADYAMNATVDMDMEGKAYVPFMKELLDEGKVSEKQIDAAVRRILHKKFELGLFDDPYRYSDEEREKEVTLAQEHRDAARDVARKSMVLLKNDDVLPFSKKVKKVAVIGPLADAKNEMIGTWSAQGEGKDAVSLLEGLKNALPDADINFVKACEVAGDDKSGFDKALKAAKKADIVIAAVGEEAMMSGEALSRMDIKLPGVQEDLVLELAKLDKPLAVVLFNGRPLVITEVAKKAPAILESWLPGTEAGNAIADVLFGDYNPSGKLTATFPYALGQVPIFYSYKHTGRPRTEARYTSKYIDGPNEPLYPFGYGLSYTTFEYTNLKLSTKKLNEGETLTVSVNLKNTGKYDGEEVVQLYVRDLVGSVTRPVKELKGFEKVSLKAGEEKTITFKLNTEDLAFYNRDWEWTTEPGEFHVFVGGNSKETIKAEFSLVD
jgi:beta-glucosidase